MRNKQEQFWLLHVLRSERVKWVAFWVWAVFSLLFPRSDSDFQQADPVTLAVIGIIAAVSSIGLQIASQLLRKPAPVEVNRSDVRLTTASFGDSIPRIYGVGASAGRIIYRSEKVSVVQLLQRGAGSGKKKQPDQLYNSYRCNLGFLVCENIDDSVLGITEIWADNTLIYSGAADGNNVTIGGPSAIISSIKAAEMQILLGKPDQLPPYFYEAEYGLGNTPAHRGMLTVWFNIFVLDDFFNRVPTFQFRVIQKDGIVKDIVARECKLAGLEDDDLDLAELDQTVTGMIVDRPTSPRNVIEALQQAKQFVITESDGKLKGIKLPSTQFIDVDWADLGASDGGYEDSGNTQTPRIQVEMVQALELPGRVEIQYYNPNRRFEQGSQGYSRALANSDGLVTLTSSLVCTGDEANQIVRINAVASWNEGLPFKFTLMPKYFHAQAGDTLRVTQPNGRKLELRLIKLQLGTADVLECTAVRQIAEAYKQIGRGAEGRFGAPANTIITPPDTGIGVYNLPPIGGDPNLPQIYFGIAPTYGNEHEWSGASVYYNLAGTNEASAETTYEHLFSTNIPSIMGVTASVLAPGIELDTAHTVDVTVRAGSLASITQEVFDNVSTKNLCVIGRDVTGRGELLQFRDATLLAIDEYGRATYRLSYLLRGMFGTEAYANNHAADEPFLLLDERVQRIPFNTELTGVALNYRAVSNGLDFNDTEYNTFTVLQNG